MTSSVAGETVEVHPGLAIGCMTGDAPREDL